VHVSAAAQSASPQRPKKIRLGDLLIEQRVITQAQLEEALAKQKQTGKKLGRQLIESGFVTEDRLLDVLARQLGVPFTDLKHQTLNPEVVRLVPEAQARRFRVIALESGPDGLLIGMADPTDIFAYDELTRILRRPLRLAIVREADLLKAIDLLYRRTAEVTALAQELDHEMAAFDVDAARLGANDNVSDAPVVKLLQTLFEDATQVNASDIHIEPEEKELRIRFRIDGVLRVQTTSERRIGAALVSRLKLMAGLDISEKRLPQDGRFNARVRNSVVDVRLSTLPTQYGESAVMRLLNHTGGVIELDQLGISDRILDRMRRIIRQPHGMLLVTGPTGSGKTTTLYGALREVNQPAVKILTVEDPIEYRLPGICQVQVNTKIDLSFARVLRSLLRQDPDVILIGEMRDQETAEIGLRAAMTGHFVLSTLHTNDAISTASRLLDMGAEPFLVATSLRAIVAQRLVRRICESCAEPHAISAAEAEFARAELGEAFSAASFRRGRGCTYCNQTGYQGRVGVYELLELDEELAALLQRGDTPGFTAAARMRPDFISLRRSAVEMAARGVTTMNQVLRVTYGVIE